MNSVTLAVSIVIYKIMSFTYACKKSAGTYMVSVTTNKENMHLSVFSKKKKIKNAEFTQQPNSTDYPLIIVFYRGDLI